MIDAKQIMIGNWFEHNANWCFRSPAEIKPFLFQWEDRDWYALSECTLNLEDCSPIPLSPELLLKCGFDERKWDNGKSSGQEYTKSIGDDGFKFSFEWGFSASAWCDFKIIGNGCYDETGEKSINEICKYLHQLQNLYHSLTGEELTITFKN